MKKSREIEIRFLEINLPQLIKRLHHLKARDYGEDFIRELIFYDKKLTWRKENKFIRLRQINGKIHLSYKHHQKNTIDGTVEIEFEINNLEKAKEFLLNLGFVCFREQEKKRHKFELNNVILDIDTWPKIPTYLEIEGKSEKDIKKMTEKLGFDYKKALFMDARQIIENIYNIPVSKYKYFTFKKVK